MKYKADTVQERRKYFLIKWSGLLFAGLFYYFFQRFSSLRIPCPFFLLTRLKCPGCGITGMCVHLLEGRFQEAALANLGLFVILPALGYLVGRNEYFYLKGRQDGSLFWKKYAPAALILYLMIWAVVRNVAGL